MGEGVAEEALTAQDGETAENAADDPEQRAAEGEGAQGVVILDVQKELAERHEEGGDEGGCAYQQPDALVGIAVFGSHVIVLSHSANSKMSVITENLGMLMFDKAESCEVKTF